MLREIFAFLEQIYDVQKQFQTVIHLKGKYDCHVKDEFF